MTFSKLQRGITIIEQKQNKLKSFGCLYCKSKGNAYWRNHNMKNDKGHTICSTAIIDRMIAQISTKTFTSNTFTFIWLSVNK